MVHITGTEKVSDYSDYVKCIYEINYGGSRRNPHNGFHSSRHPMLDSSLYFSVFKQVQRYHQHLGEETVKIRSRSERIVIDSLEFVSATRHCNLLFH